MEILDHFTIPVSGLRDGLHGFDFKVDSEFFQQFEGSLVEQADVRVHLDFDKRPDMFVMTFQFEGTVNVTCDRCLGQFDLPVEDTQELMVKFDDKEWEETEVIYILYGTQQLNVARYIYEFVNLAVPITKTHDEAGESCDPEMLKFLSESEAEEEEPTNNPLGDALKGYNFEN